MHPVQPASHPATAKVTIGHVHLRVADLDRAIAFYSDVLGFDVMQRYESGAAFLSAGGYHHHIGLNTWESAGGMPPPPGHTGLYHIAFLYPDRADWLAALARVRAAGVRLTGRADHGVSQAAYFNDPDGNGIELYWDRPRSDWPENSDGQLSMTNHPLEVDAEGWPV